MVTDRNDVGSDDGGVAVRGGRGACMVEGVADGDCDGLVRGRERSWWRWYVGRVE